MLLLVFIYYFKNILSITDIQTLLAPLTEKYFDGEGDLDLTKIYNEIVELEMAQILPLKKDITKRFNLAKDSFSDTNEEDRDYMQYFAFICLLSFDVYIKKQLIEKLIDDLPHKSKKSPRDKAPDK